MRSVPENGTPVKIEAGGTEARQPDAVARMERSEIRGCSIVCENPGLRCAQSGLRLFALPVCPYAERLSGEPSGSSENISREPETISNPCVFYAMHRGPCADLVLGGQ